MFSLLTGLSLLALIPLFILSVIFDVFMFALALGWKATKIGLKIVFCVLGLFGVLITVPAFMCILFLL